MAITILKEFVVELRREGPDILNVACSAAFFFFFFGIICAQQDTQFVVKKNALTCFFSSSSSCNRSKTAKHAVAATFVTCARTKITDALC